MSLKNLNELERRLASMTGCAAARVRDGEPIEGGSRAIEDESEIDVGFKRPLWLFTVRCCGEAWIEVHANNTPLYKLRIKRRGRDWDCKVTLCCAPQKVFNRTVLTTNQRELVSFINVTLGKLAAALGEFEAS